ncbi:MAG: hypothetical protein H6718_36150 [Polyangiaceae bacterium]|nr:hypothetical protein [Myxococcales bacterium]MCB9590894.1 hypothetical protein [Polyangiaceae bacterium]
MKTARLTSVLLLVLSPCVAVTGCVISKSSDNGFGGGPGAGGSASGGQAAGGNTAAGSSSGGSSSGGGSAGTGAVTSVGGSGGGAQFQACGAELPRLEAGGDVFDCGGSGEILEDKGRPDNRVNFVILGDGYTADLLDTLFMEHVKNLLYNTEQGYLTELGEPYRRYWSYINICALKVPSNDACVDDADTGQLCDTAFNGRGDDTSRLGIVNNSLVHSAVAALMPSNIDVDWEAVTLNAGPDNWWASGGEVMVWSGGYSPQKHASSQGIHEGGHTFHGLADEYAYFNPNADCTKAVEPNVTTDPSGAKWSEWIDFDQTPGTGTQGVYEGGRYCTQGIYRPSTNSQMNQLPDYFNMPSQQKMIHDLYAIVRPIDAHTPNDTTLVDPGVLQVRLVDASVLKVEWLVDGESLTEDGGECFDLALLPSGEHSVVARAYDDTPWVRDSRDDLEQSVTWTVSIP